MKNRQEIVRRAAQLHGAGLSRHVIAERLGCSTRRVSDLLSDAKKLAAEQ